MTEPIFDHDRLDVYRLAVQYPAESFRVAKGLSGLHRHARDQWLRATAWANRKPSTVSWSMTSTSTASLSTSTSTSTNIGAEPELVVLVLSRLRRCSCS